jgi:hypothetical protein
MLAIENGKWKSEQQTNRNAAMPAHLINAPNKKKYI